VYVSFQAVEDILFDYLRPAVLNSTLTKGAELIRRLLVLIYALKPVLQVFLKLSLDDLSPEVFNVVEFSNEIKKEVDGFIDCVALSGWLLDYSFAPKPTLHSQLDRTYEASKQKGAEPAQPCTSDEVEVLCRTYTSAIARDDAIHELPKSVQSGKPTSPTSICRIC
jgi:hypothetical protein